MDNFENNYSSKQFPEDKPSQNETSAPKKMRSGARRALSIVLVLALVIGSCGLTYGILNTQWEEKSQAAASTISSMQQQINALQSGSSNTTVATSVSYTSSYEAEQTPATIYADNVDKVVSVTCTSQTTSYGRTTQSTSSGTGFIITSDGYIVTNQHVVEDANSVTVTLTDETEYTAEVVGSDDVNDVAVLKINATDLPYVTLGNSDNLAIGDMVISIGNPLGTLTNTLTVGYVSGKNREVSTDNSTTINMIQTDATINSGNSGGPLFNMYGEVVGITTAKYSGTTSSGASIEGIGFAIPINDVLSIISDLQEYGYVKSAYLGISVSNSNMDESTMKLYNITSRVYVVSVESGSCASRAGIQVNDIIVSLGDNDVTTYDDLTRALRKFNAGDTTTITVLRSGQELTLDITLDAKPVDTDEDSTSSTGATEATESSDSDLPESGDYQEWYDYFFGDGKTGR